MSVLLEFGMRDGVLVHVTEEDLVSGLACNCTCPECGSKLVAKRGDVLAYHYAHYGIGDPDNRGFLRNGCSGGVESAAHIMAKDLIEREKQVRFPRDAWNTTTPVEDVQLEKSIATFLRPDVQVTAKGLRVAIEIHVWHRCSADKRKKLIDNQIPSFEINLQQWRHKSLTVGFREAVIHEASRSWIYDPDKAAAQTRFLRRQEKAAEDSQRLSSWAYVDLPIGNEVKSFASSGKQPSLQHTPSWWRQEPHDPVSGAWCACCWGERWWSDNRQGWCCSTCHPPLGGDGPKLLFEAGSKHYG